MDRQNKRGFCLTYFYSRHSIPFHEKNNKITVGGFMTKTILVLSFCFLAAIIFSGCATLNELILGPPDTFAEDLARQHQEFEEDLARQHQEFEDRMQKNYENLHNREQPYTSNVSPGYYQPQPRLSGQLYGITGSGHWIEDNHDGEIIILEDGSIWGISPLDQIDSMLWLPVTDITVLDNSNLLYPYKLVNTEDDEIVEARLLGFQ